MGTEWRDAEHVEIGAFRVTSPTELPTADVMIHYPDNLDPAHSAKVTLDLMLDGFRRAQAIYREVGVGLNLVGVRTGPLDPRLFAVHSTADRHPLPADRFVGMYRAAERHPESLSSEALEAFESIIDAPADSDRTVHLVALQDVFMTFADRSDGRTWQWKTITTGGLSFPGYLYGSTIPRHLRGVISITDLTKSDTSWRTIAHELGHKLMNVSHEYRDIGPQHEVWADGGLMLYGNGTDIPSGAEGRFHRERLHASPYLYRIVDGERVWNDDYMESGFYHDPIYGGLAIELESLSE